MSTIFKRLRIPAYALPVALVGGLYWLAFYPAVMTFDSLYQWQQVVSGQYTEWHPVLSTLLIGLARYCWDSPAAMVLVQIIVLSLTVGWGLAVMEDIGAPRIAVWLACVTFAISPLNGAFVVTIWKDIPYGVAILALTILVARIVMTNGRWLAKRMTWVLLGVLLAFCMLVRHNGFATALGTPLILTACYRRHWCAILGALVLCVVVFLLVKGPLYQVLGVEKRIVTSIGFNGCQMRYIPFIAQVAAHVAAQTPLKDTERDYLNEIKPLEPAWHYNKYGDSNTIRRNQFNWSVINRDPWKLLRCYAALTWRRPWVNIRHCLTHSAAVWWPWQAKTDDVFNVGIYRSPGNRIVYIYPQDKVPDLRQAPKLPRLSIKLARWVTASQSGKWNIWQSAIYLYLFLIGVAWAAWRARNAKVLVLAAPLLLHTALLLMLITSPSTRFQYPVFLIAHVFWVGLFFGRFPTGRTEAIRKSGTIVPEAYDPLPANRPQHDSLRIHGLGSDLHV